MSKGLGDTIKKLTDIIGVKQCNSCKKRQKKLNNIFPYSGFNLKSIIKELKDG